MSTLAKPLRNTLENTVKAARDVAETAARAALGHLGVGDREAPSHLSDEQKALRRRLRTHGRQLGDVFKVEAASGRSSAEDDASTRHLVREVAYEHWYRMLFARFLAENHLLMWEPGAPVTLAECAELATDPATAWGAKSGWELAGILAARMLPHIFKPLSPTLAVTFAPEHQRALEKLLAGLPAEVFTASDSLGWVYQFWQAKRKDEVNASEVKIGADELPAVTQLFIEPYMVEFLLHNSLGVWWVTRHPDQPCPVKLDYLRRVEAPSRRFYIFPDRIEVRNPGGLHNTLTPENLYAGCQPIRRNQHMAGFLRDFKSPRTGRAYMEMRGEGFLTVLRESQRLSGRWPELKVVSR